MLVISMSILTLNNPKLQIDKHSFLWKDWVEKGIITLADLYEGDNMEPFERLVSELNLPRNSL